MGKEDQRHQQQEQQEQDLDHAPYDRCRFVRNPYLRDPPALSPVALHDPRDTATLKGRLHAGWSLILREVDPQEASDFSVYTGLAGIAFLALKTAQLLSPGGKGEKEEEGDVTQASTHTYTQIHTHQYQQQRPYLEIAHRYLKSAQAALERDLRKGHREEISFILGTPGIYCQLALLKELQGKPQTEIRECVVRVLDLAHLFLDHHQHKPTRTHTHTHTHKHEYPYEILYGVSGYLTALLYLKENIAWESVPDTLIQACVDHIMAGAIENEKEGKGPGGSSLMWTWHDKPYLGAAHGVSGILLTLLEVHERVMPLSQTYLEKIHATVEYLHSLQMPSGNYPTQPLKQEDRLVQWCHGAPGVLLLFVRAYEVFQEPKYLAWAELASDVVWTRGLLQKGNGLCHGIGGNAYCFLILYRATGNDIYLFRARQFALSAEDPQVEKYQRTPDHPWSLFEGLAGLMCLYTDLVVGQPEMAVFPAVEIFGPNGGGGGGGLEGMKEG